MSTIGNKLNLLDVSRRLDPNGKIPNIVEMMAQVNEVIDDIPWMECNDGAAHVTTQRTGLPDVFWRKYNQFIPSSKSATAQISDTCGMMDAYSEIDAKLLQKNGNSAAWLLSEEKPFVESLTQQVVNTMFYGDITKNPERFMGFAPRYADKSGANNVNILDMAGKTNLTRIWVVVWGPESVCGLYPQGSKAGISHTDKGVSTVYDKEGNKMEAHVTHFQQDAGVCVRDWRQIVRIANIDSTALLTAGDKTDTSADIEKALIEAMNIIHNENACRMVVYMHNRVRAMMTAKLYEKGNVKFDYEEIIKGFPRKLPFFLGAPLKRVDGISLNETLVK